MVADLGVERTVADHMLVVEDIVDSRSRMAVVDHINCSRHTVEDRHRMIPFAWQQALELRQGPCKLVAWRLHLKVADTLVEVLLLVVVHQLSFLLVLGHQLSFLLVLVHLLFSLQA
jgi:hypothetical protein